MKKRLLGVALAVVMVVCFVLLIVVMKTDLENKALRAENSELKQSHETETEELAPCYLCGGNAKIQPVNDSFYIRCEDCGLETDFFKSKSDLIRYWNKD